MESILFTGASGFLGCNIIPILSKRYKIDTIGLFSNNTYNIDLSQNVPLLQKNYDIVIHAAGKAHINPSSDREKQLFFDVNLQGTKNLCKALEKVMFLKSFIFISTVAVYGLNYGENITEEHPLNGITPYAQSKIQAEYFLQDWCSLHEINLVIIRPSLIAGINPPGNLGAMLKGINSGKYFRIGSGSARKSVLMAEDIALIIPKLIEINGTYNVCDNHHPSFKELEELFAKQLNKKAPKAIPYWVAKFLALIGDKLFNKFPINSYKLNKIVKPLTFSNEKAKHDLKWEPLDVLQNFKIH